MSIYVQGGIILAIVAAVFGVVLFFANRRAKRNIAAARQRSADSRASLTSSPTHLNPKVGGSNKSAERAKKKRARKLASQQRRRNRQ